MPKRDLLINLLITKEIIPKGALGKRQKLPFFVIGKKVVTKIELSEPDNKGEQNLNCYFFRGTLRKMSSVSRTLIPIFMEKKKVLCWLTKTSSSISETLGIMKENFFIINYLNDIGVFGMGNAAN